MVERSHINNTEWSPDGTIAVMESLNVAMAFSNARESMAPQPTKQLNVGATEVISTEKNQDVLAYYGENNSYPTDLYKVINSNSKLKVGLQHAQFELLGGGVETVVDSDTGYVRKVFPDWKTLYDKANFIRNYEVLAAKSLKTYYMIFASVVLSKDGRRVVSLKAVSPKHCVLSKPNAEGFSEYCYIYPDWKSAGTGQIPKDAKKIPVINNFINTAAVLKERIKSEKTREFMYVVKFPTDEIIYPRPDWTSVIEQGWVDVSNDVPTFKRWLMKNMTTVNQIMYISESYFESVYPDWKELIKRCAKDDKTVIDGKTAFQIIKERREAVVKYVEDKLSGLEASGKMITAPMVSARLGGDKMELIKSITIEKIDQNNFSEKYNADANEADTQIYAALRIDPSKYGNLTRTDSQGGTGKREAFNISQSSEYIFEELFLELYYFVRDYNEMPAEMEFQIRRTSMQTLDKVTPSKRETTLN